MARQIGLKDIHIAILKNDTSAGAAYDTPIKLERAIAAKLSPKANSENIYSDDIVEDITRRMLILYLVVENIYRLVETRLGNKIFLQPKNFI